VTAHASVASAGRSNAAGRGGAPLAEPGFAHLLHQADHWATWSDGGQLVRIRLDDMSPDHRRRTLAYLRAHAEFFHTRQLDTLGRLYRRGGLSDREFGDETAYLRALDPHVWLDDTALVRRLVQLTPTPPAPARRRRFLPWRLR